MLDFNNKPTKYDRDILLGDGGRILPNSGEQIPS
jgi:hypothetical protein